jgi:hypothetical protein
MPNGGKIYLVAGEKQLTPMDESFYDSEDVLQDYLASYPDLLAGEQIQPKSPLRWLFIQREIGIPGEKGEGNRWSLDHLFVDQEGVPTFVECKRSSDTRIRREVIGQMLDYAANAIEYWPTERLRQSAAETAQKAGHDLDDLVLSLINLSDEVDTEEAVEGFWQSVETNLRDGRLRLLFVSDRIPSELRRVVEFLNNQMDRTEVLAIEVKQYTGGDKTALVPRVLGLSEIAKQKKESTRKPRRSTPWTESEFLEDLRSRSLQETRVAVIEELLEVAKKLQANGLVTISWGRGTEVGSFSIKQSGNNYLTGWSNATMQLQMGSWKHPEQIKSQLAAELGKKLNFDLQYRGHAYPEIMNHVFAVEDGVAKLNQWLEYAIQLTESVQENSGG